MRVRNSGDTALCPRARHFIRSLVLVQPRNSGNGPDLTEKLLTETLYNNTNNIGEFY